jgi:hypothetical protein
MQRIAIDEMTLGGRHCPGPSGQSLGGGGHRKLFAE